MAGHDERMAALDHLPPAHAAARAWRPLDPRRHGTWHQHSRDQVADLMPLLARALDRLLEDLVDEMPGVNDALWLELSQLARPAQEGSRP